VGDLNMKGISEMKDTFPELSDEEMSARYPAVAKQLTAAYSFVQRYRQDSDAKMQEAEMCGLTEAWTFLESAEHGLFDNRNAWHLYNAQFIVDKVRPERPVGGIDFILDRSAQTIRALQTGETTNSEDLARAETLLYDIITEMTGKPPVYAVYE
jgi:hypothetical protein